MNLSHALKITYNRINTRPCGELRAQDRSGRYAVDQRLGNQRAGNFRFALKWHLLRNASLFPPRPIHGPRFRSIPSPSDRSRHLAIRDYQFDRDLARRRFAYRPTVLLAHPYRLLPLLEPPGLIHHPGVQRFHHRGDFAPYGPPHGAIRPRAAADQLLQFLAAHPSASGHRLDRFTLARHQQARHVQGRTLPALATPDVGDQGLDKTLQFAILPLPVG